MHIDADGVISTTIAGHPLVAGALQASGGTMTSPPSGWRIFSTAIDSRLAEAPAFTNTLCLTPSQFDHSCSKATH